MKKKVPLKLENLILYNSAYTCNVCRNKNNGIHIHHIDENANNNKYDNLILLCISCHNEAHTKRSLTKNLTSNKLKFCKSKWEDEVKEKSSLSMLPQKTLINQTMWSYVNHQKVIELMEINNLQFDDYLFSELTKSNVIDLYGIPKNIPQKNNNMFVTIYDSFNYSDSQRLHKMFCRAVNELIINSNPIEIGAIWSKRKIKSIIEPGQLIFTLRGFYFKSGKLIDNVEDRIVYGRSKNIELRWYVNTRNMFGTSALYNSFSGHRVAAALLLVKTVLLKNNILTIHCTPISMGAGFIKGFNDSPHKSMYHQNSFVTFIKEDDDTFID